MYLSFFSPMSVGVYFPNNIENFELIDATIQIYSSFLHRLIFSLFHHIDSIFRFNVRSFDKSQFFFPFEFVFSFCCALLFLKWFTLCLSPFSRKGKYSAHLYILKLLTMVMVQSILHCIFSRILTMELVHFIFFSNIICVSVGTGKKNKSQKLYIGVTLSHRLVKCAVRAFCRRFSHSNDITFSKHGIKFLCTQCSVVLR